MPLYLLPMSSLPSPPPMALSLMGKLKGLGLALYMMDLLYMDLDMEPMKLLGMLPLLLKLL